jgi:hypothetical protein
MIMFRSFLSGFAGLSSASRLRSREHQRYEISGSNFCRKAKGLRGTLGGSAMTPRKEKTELTLTKTLESENLRDGRKRVSRLHGARYIAVNVFLVFHILAITCWCIPANGFLFLAFRSAVQPYLLWSGLFQSWDMFSPNPKDVNSYVEAIIIYKDGSTQFWTFPRMQLLGLTERYYRERYRKFEENLLQSKYSALWPDAARHVVRNYNNPSNPPQTVMLLVRWSNIVPRADGALERSPWDAHVFYSYAVRPEDLI